VSKAIPERVRTLMERFLGDHGVAPLAVRKAAYERARALGSGAPTQLTLHDDLVDWVETIAVNPSTASDAGVLELKAAGYSEDDIVEITEAAALGASLARLETAYRVIGEA